MRGRGGTVSETLVRVAIEGNIATREQVRRPATARVVAALALLAVAFAAYAATAERSAGHLDYWSANFASWHLAHTGSPFVEGVSMPPLDDNTERFVWLQEPAPNGHTVVARAPGVVLAGMPGYLLTGQDHFSLGPASLTAALLVTLSLLLVFLALRTRLSWRRSLLGSAALGFTTPVWTVSADGIWPHTVTGLGIAGMAWAAATRRYWLVGVFGGVAISGRMHTAVIVAVLGLALAYERRDLRVAVQVAVPSVTVLVAECFWSHWMYGSWNPMASYGGSAAVSLLDENLLDVTNYLGMWVAPDRGILVWSPVVLLLLPALVRSWREQPVWARALLGGGLAYTLIQSALITFTGGDFFYGQRLGLELLVCATPALCFSVARAGRVARGLLAPLLAAQLFVMAVGAVNPAAFVEERLVWSHNVFVDAMAKVGPPGWVAFVVTILIGALVARAVELSRQDGARDDQLPLGPVGSGVHHGTSADLG